MTEDRRLSEEEAEEELMGVRNVCQIILMCDTEKLENLKAECDRWDTTGPIFFPSQWISNHRAVVNNAKLIGVILDAQKQIREIAGR